MIEGDAAPKFIAGLIDDTDRSSRVLPLYFATQNSSSIPWKSLLGLKSNFPPRVREAYLVASFCRNTVTMVESGTGFPFLSEAIKPMRNCPPVGLATDRRENTSSHS